MLPMMRRQCLDALGTLTREQALEIACLKCSRKTAAWVTTLYRAGTLEARCLGRFDLTNDRDPALPWPALMFLVRGKPGGSGRLRSCALAVHHSLDEVGKWVVTDAEPVAITQEQGRMHVNGQGFVGGEGLLGGDAPSTTPERPLAPPRSGVGKPQSRRIGTRQRRGKRAPRESSSSAQPAPASRPVSRAAPPTPPAPEPAAPAASRLALAVELLRLLDRLCGS